MSLGVRNVEDADIEKMMNEASGALNFTTFLNMLAEKLHGTDPEDVMIEGSFFFRIVADTFCSLQGLGPGWNWQDPLLAVDRSPYL